MVSLPSFSPRSFLSCLVRYPVTHMNLVPPIVNFLALNPLVTKEQHLSSLEMIASGGAPLSSIALDKFRAKMMTKDFDFKEGYGLTEVPALMRTNPAFKEEKRGSVGQVLPNTKVKVVDVDTGECVGVGKPGELCVKGPQVCLGYFENPDATAEAIDSEGWFHTGDVVEYDEEEFFYIVDRIKDMIKVKGFQVAPTELEEVIRGCRGVLDVAVIGIKDDVLGEAPKAFIVRKPESIDEDENKLKESIHDFLKEKVATYKQLSGGIVFVEELPKNPTGKILRKELRNL